MQSRRSFNQIEDRGGRRDFPRREPSYGNDFYDRNSSSQRYGQFGYGQELHDRGERGSYSSDYPPQDYQAGYRENPMGRRYYEDQAPYSSSPSWNARPQYNRPTYRGNQQSFGSDYTDEDYGSIAGTSDTQSNWNQRTRNTPGIYHGVGPKGYKRSDERIKEEICDMLTHDSTIDAADIDVDVKDGEVTLSGTVSERAMKHMAEQVADRAQGVRDIHNQLKVKKSSSNWESTGQEEDPSLSSTKTSSSGKKSSAPNH